MLDNPNTDNVSEQPWLDAEDWEIALQPYAGNPDAALVLAVHFTVLKNHLNAEPINLEETLNEIDLAVEVLFMHSRLHDTCYVLFRKLAEGKLSVEEEKMLKLLGYKKP